MVIDVSLEFLIPRKIKARPFANKKSLELVVLVRLKEKKTV